MVEPELETSTPRLKNTATKLPKSDVTRFANAFGAKLGMRISPATHICLVEIATEFIEAITSESASFAIEDNVNSLRPDHLLRSLEHLGFASYIPEVNAEHERVKAEEPSHRAKLAAKREKKKKMETPEMVQLQQELFAAARNTSLVHLTKATQR